MSDEPADVATAVAQPERAAGDGRRAADSYNEFIARHEIAWELGMAALAVAYVAIGFVLDAASPPLVGWLAAAEAAITVIFVIEFASRFAASHDRRSYLRGHWIDLIALIPAIREVRVLRLLRFLRLLRAAAGIYRALGIPLFRRLGWHLVRVKDQFDARTSLLLTGLLSGTVLVAAALVTWMEGPLTFEQFGESIYWSITTLLGSGDAGFVSSVVGRFISSALIVFSLTFLAVATGLVVGFIIDVVLKEGQGMGIAGLTDHIVVCGWNSTAREVIAELRADEDDRKLVLIADVERNPAGSGVYFVRGDPANVDDLNRASIQDAVAAIVFPARFDDDADMRSILIVMTIEDLAPHVRTVVEAANPRNVEHMKRAHADEVIAAPQLVAHLLARSAIHSGLGDLVMDMVTGGEGSELYRVQLPADLANLTAADAGAALRRDYRATLLALVRDGEHVVNPPGDFALQEGDELLVLAESLDALTPASAAAVP